MLRHGSPADKEEFTVAATVVAPKPARPQRPRIAAVFGTFTPYLNRYIVRIAGSRYTPMWALIRHRGRRSGREYLTPITARPVQGGFAIPVAFGEGADWYRNVMASRTAAVRWGGSWHEVEAASAIDPDAAVFAFPGWQRALFRALGIRRFVYLKEREAD
jgi:deazaflavin-dependent oxidoreductase (nitroreductase family)